jgi:hypothetical protein
MDEITFGELQMTLSPFHISRLLQNLPAPYTMFGYIAGAHGSSRFIRYVIWKGDTKRFQTGDRWDLCVSELPQDFTGFTNGHVYVVENEL